MDGLNTLLAAFDRHKSLITDIRWTAYMLATTFHETGFKMQPVEEIGKGRGHAYGVPTGPWHEVYDGEGDVQLTWIANYEKANTALHKLGVLSANEDMVKDPKLALRPDVAAAVLILGMTQGWFTGKKLSDYFNSRITDSVGARRIINGQDQARRIAGYYRDFLAALKSASALPVAA